MTDAMAETITAEWLHAPETRAVALALDASKLEARFVGGCVRNALLGSPATDIDIAVAASPELVIEAILELVNKLD